MLPFVVLLQPIGCLPSDPLTSVFISASPLTIDNELNHQSVHSIRKWLLVSSFLQYPCRMTKYGLVFVQAFNWIGWFCSKWYFDFSWSFALPLAISFQSNLHKHSSTDTLLNINTLKLSPVQIIIEHRFKISIMTFVTRSLIIDSVREEGVETKTDEEGFANLAWSMGTSLLEQWSLDWVLFRGRFRSLPIRLSKMLLLISILL